MVQVTFIGRDESVTVVNARPGFSLMEAAVQADIVGIDADCRGACSCATCHVHIAAEWYETVGAPKELEQDLLSISEELSPTSRLSCQIRISPDLDGLIARVP